MIRNNIVVRDWETGGRNPNRCQPTQLAAVVIDSRSLEIIPDSLYNVMIQPEWDDEKCVALDVDPVSEEALNKCNFTKASFDNAINPKLAWKDYVQYLTKYNLKGTKGNKWDAVHACGFNSTNFDDIIDNRMCQQYGPKPDDRGLTIYHPTLNIDVYPLVNLMFNSLRINNTNSLSMDSLREYFGMDADLAHSGHFDVLQTAYVLIKALKLFRNLTDGTIHLPMGKKIKFHDCFEEENRKIRNFLK